MAVEKQRIHLRNDCTPTGDGCYALYWMQQSQRPHHNPALEHAIDLANACGQSVLVGFGEVRSMTAAGLARKFDVDADVEWAARL